MSDELAIADRRQLRRKLTFWRAGAVVALLAAAAGLMAAGGGISSAPHMRDHIARVAITGLIQDDRELLERIARIGETASAKAMVVTISSPGGTTYGGEVIYKAIRKVAEKKPVVSDIRTLAASAGYMVAVGGDTIVAGESSITGSIGVIFQYPQVGELMDKIGISIDEIKSAPLKAEPSPFHPASDAAKAMIQSMIDDSFDWFVTMVADRRKLPVAEVRTLADGRILTGRQALAARLVDTLGGEAEIRTYLTTRKIVADLPIVDWEAPRPTLLNGFGAHAADWAKTLGYVMFPSLGRFENNVADKLFLDGLVSVWQVGRS